MIHFEILFFNYFKIFFSGENHFIRTSCNYPSGAHDFVCSLHSFFHPPISGQLINKAVCKHAYTKMLLTFATISGWLFPLFARFSTHFPCPSAFLYAMRHLLSAGFFMIIISLAPPVFFPRLFVIACAGGVMWLFLHPSWRNFHLPLVLLPFFFVMGAVCWCFVLCHHRHASQTNHQTNKCKRVFWEWPARHKGNGKWKDSTHKMLFVNKKSWQGQKQQSE